MFSCGAPSLSLSLCHANHSPKLTPPPPLVPPSASDSLANSQSLALFQTVYHDPFAPPALFHLPPTSALAALPFSSSWTLTSSEPYLSPETRAFFSPYPAARPHWASASTTPGAAPGAALLPLPLVVLARLGDALRRAAQRGWALRGGGGAAGAAAQAAQGAVRRVVRVPS